MPASSTWRRSSPAPGPRIVETKAPRRARRWPWIIGGLMLAIGAAVFCVRYALSHAEPILRTRVIETLSTRFKSRVELATLHVSLFNGLQVSGGGLQIFGATDPNPYEPGVQPLLEIREFRFQTPLRDLFREPMRVQTVYVNGLTVNIPPPKDRQQVRSMRRGKMSIWVSEFKCEDTRLLINTSRPGRPPLDFEISRLKLKDVGPNQPLRFDATLINPRPVGDIQSVGEFGPLNEMSPRDTAVEGNYRFTNADLGTLKGISGTLSSTGIYGGTLGRIEVEGTTDTPDFRVNTSGHPVALHTDFHAIVDGTDGDTYLQPVKARFLHSALTAQGKVVRASPRGHNIVLDVMIGRARIEDLLRLGVRTDPPIMQGKVEMRTKLRLPPSDKDIAGRLELDGTFHVPNGLFTSEKIQGRIDSFSLRSMGKPKLVKHVPEEDSNVVSDLSGNFKLRDGVLTFSMLHFAIPGTHADMTGEYTLDGSIFDFHGKLKLKAKLSQMTTGWKSILLKPVDPFFRKNGAGAEIPFKVSGTRDDLHFGVDFGHKDKHPQTADTAQAHP